MANYVINYTGEEVEKLLTSVGKFITPNVTASDITFRQVTWEIAPTSTNLVYGLAIHPSDGKLYRVKSDHGVITAEAYNPAGTVPEVENTVLVFKTV